MSYRRPSLASRPFVNLRPVRRITMVLWLLGLSLLVLNVILWRSYFTSSDDRERDLASTNEAIESYQQRIDSARQQLSALDLSAQNAQVDFLNRRIAQRVFGWSELFDEMERVLPNDVRLLSLTPREVENDGSGRGPRLPDVGDRIPVRLTLKAIAKNEDAQLQLLDRLFSSPAFVGPILRRESSEDGGQVQFDLETLYLAPPLVVEEDELPPVQQAQLEEVDVGAGDRDIRAADGQGSSSNSAGNAWRSGSTASNATDDGGNGSNRALRQGEEPPAAFPPGMTREEKRQAREERRERRRSGRADSPSEGGASQDRAAQASATEGAAPTDRRSSARQELLERVRAEEAGRGRGSQGSASGGTATESPSSVNFPRGGGAGAPSRGTTTTTGGSTLPSSPTGRRLSASGTLEPQ